MEFTAVGNAALVAYQGDAGIFEHCGRLALALRLDGEILFCSHDTDENRARHEVLASLSGQLIVSGLGVGEMMPVLELNRGLDQITIVEKSPDVLALMLPRLGLAGNVNPRFRIICADIDDYTPGPGFDGSIWLDHLVRCDEAETLAYKATVERLRPRCSWIGGCLGEVS